MDIVLFSGYNDPVKVFNFITVEYYPDLAVLRVQRSLFKFTNYNLV